MNQGQQRIPCPKCRANNFLGQSNCWQCGSSLPPPEAVAQMAAPTVAPQASPFARPAAGYAPTRKGGAWKIVVPIVLVVVVAAGGLLYLGSRSQKQRQSNLPPEILRELDQLQARAGKASNSASSANEPVDPDVAAAQRTIDKFRREHPGMAPPTDAEGNVHLQTGGTITREQWEKARNAVTRGVGQ